MRFEVSAGGVVVREQDGKWELAVIRPRGKTVWALPKGHIDGGETAEQTAAREVREETGLSGRLAGKLGEVRYVYQFRGQRISKVVSFYLLHHESGEIDQLDPAMRVEVAEARWVPLDDSQRVLAYKGEREMAQRAQQMLARPPLKA